MSSYSSQVDHYLDLERSFVNEDASSSSSQRQSSFGSSSQRQASSSSSSSQRSPGPRMDPLSIVINHIKLEMSASLFYQEASAILRLSSYSLTGFGEYFLSKSREKQGNANTALNYLVSRDFEFHYPRLNVLNVQIQDSSYSMLLHILVRAEEVEGYLYNSLYRMATSTDISLSDVAVEWLHDQEHDSTSIRSLLTKVRDSGAQNIHILDQKMHSM